MFWGWKQLAAILYEVVATLMGDGAVPERTVATARTAAARPLGKRDRGEHPIPADRVDVPVTSVAARSCVQGVQLSSVAHFGAISRP